MRAKTFRLVLVFYFISLVILFCAQLLRAETIQLQWDKSDSADGYYIYQAIRAGNPPEHQFDYTNPIKTDAYPDGKIPADVTALNIDLPGEKGVDTKYVFTARAFMGDESSIDSNVVSYVVSLVPPPAATELTGSYDKAKNLITISWAQPPEDAAWRQVDHWMIFYRIGESDWVTIGRIDAGQGMTLTAPIDAVAVGERSTVDFVIVSYRRSGAYSANSNVISIDVDRREVSPVQNLRISIGIPLL